MLYDKKIIDVYGNNNAELMTTLCGKIAYFYHVKHIGTYINHWALHG